jgi:diphosphomevalonate decarboxylase
MTRRQEIVRELTAHTAGSPQPEARAFAPANVALCKYWGKRDADLNLPVSSSLSISLGSLGTTTELRLRQGADHIVSDCLELSPDDKFCTRLSAFLDLFRPDADTGFVVETQNTVPTAAGLASSASGYAALVLALDDLFQWQLNREQLSILARLGSGSAARSVYNGFVIWHCGASDGGMDSVAERITDEWPELRVGVVIVSDSEKPISSREAMARTVASSPFFDRWKAVAEADMQQLREAIGNHAFELLGTTAESNAMAMHALMLASWPPVLYWTGATIDVLQRVWALREDGVPVYCTIDAGPNVKLLFLDEAEARVREAFEEATIVQPFGELDERGDWWCYFNRPELSRTSVDRR